jgi:hypothetical protein
LFPPPNFSISVSPALSLPSACLISNTHTHARTHTHKYVVHSTQWFVLHAANAFFRQTSKKINFIRAIIRWSSVTGIRPCLQSSTNALVWSEWEILERIKKLFGFISTLVFATTWASPQLYTSFMLWGWQRSLTQLDC